MPRYQYECQACEQSFEYKQGFTDDPLADCVLCGTKDAVDRVITSVGVIFKGSGFYINDSKNKKKSDISTLKTNSESKNTSESEKIETKKSETKQSETEQSETKKPETKKPETKKSETKQSERA